MRGRSVSRDGSSRSSKRSRVVSRSRSYGPSGLAPFNTEQKSYIARLITSKSEKKQQCLSVNAVCDCVLSLISDMNRVVPTIGQGVDDGQRIGNNIEPKSLVIKGHYLWNQLFNATVQNTIVPSCRIGVRMMIVQPKMYHTYIDAQLNPNSWLPYLLNDGISSTSFTGTVKNLYQDLNTDIVDIFYDKVSYISMPTLVLSTTATWADDVVPVRETVKFFNIKLKCPKTLNFSDRLSAENVNFNPIVLVAFSYLDGTTTSGTSLLNLFYDSKMTYTDA